MKESVIMIVSVCCFSCMLHVLGLLSNDLCLSRLATIYCMSLREERAYSFVGIVLFDTCNVTDCLIG